MGYNFKLGDRVEFACNGKFSDYKGSTNPDLYDLGTVVANDSTSVKVKWDSNGEVTSPDPDYVRKLTTQSKARPHAELIKAWADGAEIEYFDPFYELMWRPAGVPIWDPMHVYRIKPEKEQILCKEIKLVAFIDEQGGLRWVREDLFANTNCQYVRVPSEDKTVTVEVVSK